jgi:hypothetical protein
MAGVQVKMAAAELAQKGPTVEIFCLSLGGLCVNSH